MAKRLGGIIGCIDETSSWHLNGFPVVTLGQLYNVGRSPSLYCVCVVCVFFSHSFRTSSSLDVPAGVTQEEGHTGFLIRLCTVHLH